MNLRDYQHWLCEEQWNGAPLETMILLSAPNHAVTENAMRALRSLAIITEGVCGEAGEVSEHFKKWKRDGVINKYAAGLEIGDALAYLTWLAKTLGYTLEDIAQLNYAKLTARGKPTPR